MEKAEKLILKSYKDDYYAWGHLQDEHGRIVKYVSFEELKDSLLDRMLIGKPDEITEKL